MTKPKDGDILAPEPHAYDTPGLPPKEWLRRVMDDMRLPMQTRIEAAKACAVYEHPRLQQVASDITAGIRIRIEGGLPELPGTNIIMPETDEPKKTTNGSGQPQNNES